MNPHQLANHFHPVAVYWDETGYPGMIYLWLDTPCLPYGVALPDALDQAGFGGVGRTGTLRKIDVHAIGKTVIPAGK